MSSRRDAYIFNITLGSFSHVCIYVKMILLYREYNPVSHFPIRIMEFIHTYAPIYSFIYIRAYNVLATHNIRVLIYKSLILKFETLRGGLRRKFATHRNPFALSAQSVAYAIIMLLWVCINWMRVNRVNDINIECVCASINENVTCKRRQQSIIYVWPLTAAYMRHNARQAGDELTAWMQQTTLICPTLFKCDNISKEDIYIFKRYTLEIIYFLGE